LCHSQCARSHRSKRPRIGVMAARPPTIRPARTAEMVRKAGPPFRLSLSLPPSHFDGHFPSVAWQRTNTSCPRDRALSWSKSAMLRGGSVAQPKLTQSKNHQDHSLQRAAFLFPPMSVPVSPRSNGPPAATNAASPCSIAKRSTCTAILRSSISATRIASGLALMIRNVLGAHCVVSSASGNLPGT
jgi:hypothetical protein